MNEKVIKIFIFAFCVTIFINNMFAYITDEKIAIDTNIKKVLILVDPYPSKLIDLFTYCNKNHFNYFFYHRITKDNLYMYIFAFYNIDEANLAKEKMISCTGTETSALQDIGSIETNQNFLNEQYLKLFFEDK